MTIVVTIAVALNVILFVWAIRNHIQFKKAFKAMQDKQNDFFKNN